ncbi:chloramphenicol resistance protein [Clostridioides difficile]|uniref:Chloramphenicol resistance protein n=1 Tax=Clostridium phage phiCD146 TaxID=1582151 RepID=A0A0A8WET2_9CAUD|nr:chloramphenicol resistance protein [Clostridioides difficile]YP_009214139.1 tail completion [Clostridium phage phiCD146]MBH7002491.1 chloramphenicol resistance protein [Clostridioides difficile]MBH7225035.1 chloramphenicol resistance protein [Clostridioides difficile]MBY2217772.1 chloramphenicol resistance protein [Clostridioides difficile]MCH4300251.1 chloramphenicol resistance protein [Clostridioides difficile]MCW0758777.1 chloramphenicol resistance protein [Clostridioides difficile]
MTIIESVREFIKKCPYLDEFAKSINVEFLGEEFTSYTLETVPSETVIKRFINGDSIKQFIFIFASRECYGSDVMQNIENSQFYEQFADWIYRENLSGNLPALSGNKEAMSLEVSTPGYPVQTSIDTAQYQIQLKLKYFEKGEM